MMTLADLRATALAKARTLGAASVGVYLEPSGVWHAFAMNGAALRDWYEEIASSPGLYAYIAAIDHGAIVVDTLSSAEAARQKAQAEAGMHPALPASADVHGGEQRDERGFWRSVGDVFETAYEGIASTVSGLTGRDTMQPLDKLRALDKIIALHEAFWGRLAQERPSNDLRIFLQEHWDPFFTVWEQTYRQMGAYLDASEFVQAVVDDYALRLSRLRELAAGTFLVQTPDLGTARHGVAVSGPHHGGGGGGGFGGAHHGGGGWGGGRRNFGGGWGGYYGYPWYPYPYVVYEVPEVIEEVQVVYCDPNDPTCAQAVVQGDMTITVHHAGERLAGLACAGLFDSISGAISSAVNGVTDVAKAAYGTVGHTLGQLKGPIGAAASMAAAGAAAAIPGAGPFVAPLAGSLAKNLVDAAAGGADVKAASQAVIGQAARQAQSNPQIAAALAAAQHATVQATAGYHAIQTAANAQAGNPDAHAQLTELHNAAAGGDPHASDMISLAREFGEALGRDDRAGTLRDPSWQVDPSAIEMDSSGAPAASSGWVRLGAVAVTATAREQASNAAKEFPARVIGVVQLADGTWKLEAFETSDAADDWYGQWLGLPHAFRYLAYYDRSDATFPGPLNEAQGAPLGARIASSGALLPVVAALGGAAAGYFGPGAYHRAKAWWSARKEHTQARASGIGPGAVALGVPAAILAAIALPMFAL